MEESKVWFEELDFPVMPRKRVLAEIMRRVEERAAAARAAGLDHCPHLVLARRLEPSAAAASPAGRPPAPGREEPASEPQRDAEPGYRMVWEGPEATRLMGAWAPPPGRERVLQVLRWAQSLAELLACAHAGGQVLNGPNLNNLLLQSSSVAAASGLDVAVADPVVDSWLLAYRRTSADERHFTPAEVINGQPWGPAADLFSLGVTLYFLLTGHYPFEDPEGVEAEVDNILQRPPISARAYNADIGVSLDQLLLSLLAKDPARRPAASDLSQALGALAASGQALATPEEIGKARKAAQEAGRQQAKAAWQRRLRNWRTGLIAGAVALAAVIYLVFLGGSGTPKAVTPQSTPRQVAEVFYDGMRHLDVTRMQQAITRKAGGRVIDWISQLYVITKVTGAMEMQRSALPPPAPDNRGGKGASVPPAAPAAPQSAGGLSAFNPTLPMSHFVLKEVGRDAQGVSFRAEYDLTLPRGAQERLHMHYSDFLRVERVGNLWQIVRFQQKATPAP